MRPKRTDRLASQLIEEISDIIRRKVSDPRLSWVTLTRAEVAPDMKEAHVYVRTLDAAKMADVLAGLEHAEGYFRHELGNRLEWRVIPNIHFHPDKQAEEAENVLRIIAELKEGGEHADGGTETGA